jgi:hypothetical protein
MQLELKKLKFGLTGREGIRTFECELFVDGVRTAYVNEDGNGGCLRIHITEPYDTTRPILQAVKEYCKILPSIFSKKDKNSDLDEQIIQMVSDVEIAKELKVKQKKFICYRDSTCENGGYKMASFGKFTIEQVLADPKGVLELTKLINNLQADGTKILNTNFGSLQSLVK